MDNASQYWMVIPATGTGERMNADCPKQYLKLSAKTILQHTLDNVLSHPAISGAVLILNSEDHYWQQLNYQHAKPVYLCTGGKQRYHSVYNGLVTLKQKLNENPIVLIHDAVRPFVSHTDLDNLLEAVDNNEAGALLAAPVTDTLKVVDNNLTVKCTHPRENLWRAFTPQAFKLDKILAALDTVIKDGLAITDDASAMELMGYNPSLVAGDGHNIKITTPQDLVLAELLTRQ